MNILRDEIRNIETLEECSSVFRGGTLWSYSVSALLRSPRRSAYFPTASILLLFHYVRSPVSKLPDIR